MGPTRINTILQSAFFKLAKIIDEKDAIRFMKNAAEKTYSNKGKEIVEKNWAAIDAGADEKNLIEVTVPDAWGSAADEGLDFRKAEGDRKDVVDFVNTVQVKVNSQQGNRLTVKEAMTYTDGSTPSGSSAFEKRGIAVNVPAWDPEKCIQCSICSYVCPHAAVRPVAMTEEEAKNAPEGMKFVPLKQMDGYQFGIVISALDCTGCGSCTQECPGNRQSDGNTLKM